MFRTWKSVLVALTLFGLALPLVPPTKAAGPHQQIQPQQAQEYPPPAPGLKPGPTNQYSPEALQQRSEPTLAPGTSSDGVQWKLGIYQRVIPGYGLRVTRVVPDSPAERIGLEVGDTITSVNGRAICSLDDWHDALEDSNGFVRLRIVDWRTGRAVYRNVWLEAQ
jgi:membrane-associated protease RseP (regulator of RpoE activity)